MATPNAPPKMKDGALQQKSSSQAKKPKEKSLTRKKPGTRDQEKTVLLQRKKVRVDAASYLGSIVCGRGKAAAWPMPEDGAPTNGCSEAARKPKE